MAIKEGDTVVYTKTGTAGKVVRVVNIENRQWAELDSTGLLYDENVLEPANVATLKDEKVEREREQDRKRRSETSEWKDVEKEMKDEGTLDSSAGVCGAG